MNETIWKDIPDIRTPIWKGRCVGIANFRLPPTGGVKFKISYKTKDDKTLYPFTYGILTEDAKKYPTKVVGSGITLHIIPIKDLKVMEE